MRSTKQMHVYAMLMRALRAKSVLLSPKMRAAMPCRARTKSAQSALCKKCVQQVLRPKNVQPMPPPTASASCLCRRMQKHKSAVKRQFCAYAARSRRVVRSTQRKSGNTQRQRAHKCPKAQRRKMSAKSAAVRQARSKCAVQTIVQKFIDIIVAAK